MSDLILPASLAIWDPLGGTQEPVMTGHDGVCVHTMAGSFVGTDAYFHQDGWQGTESTVGVAGSGFCKQWVPWNRQADANLEGNSRWLSIECADKGEGFPLGELGNDGPPLTAAQIDRIVALCRYWCSVEAHRNCPTSWTCHREGIPRRFVTSSCERGVGVHRHGIDPWRKAGCPHWSSSAGKICPRTVRLEQVKNIVVPRLAGPVPTPAPTFLEDEDMAFTYTTAGSPVFFCHAGKSVGLNEQTDLSALRKGYTDADQKLPHLALDDDTYRKFRARYPGD